MTKWNGYIKRYFPVLIIFIAILIIIGYYFLVNIKDKESELNERGFRILRSIAQNLEEKQLSNHKTLDLYSGREWTGRYINKFIKDIEIVHREELKEYFKKDSFNLIKDEGVWNFGYRCKIRDTVCAEGGKCKFVGDACLIYKIKAETFIEPIINYRTDFFNEYIFLSGDSVIYQTKSLSYSAIFSRVKDTINKENYIKGNFFKRINLAGVDYVVFFHPLQSSFELNKTTICGLIKVKDYNKLLYSTGNYTFLTLFLLILLAFLLLPFIKLATMGAYERFIKADFAYLIVSFFLVSVVISIPFVNTTLTLSSFLPPFENTSLKDVCTEELKKINKDIKAVFELEINNSVEELCTLEDQLTDSSVLTKIRELNSSKHSKPEITPEIIYEEDTSEIRSLLNSTDLEKYGYLLFMLKDGRIANRWVNSGTLPSYRINTIAVNERLYYANLLDSSKSYIYYKKKKESNPGEIKFYMEPIISWSQQENVVTFSKKASPALKSSYKKSFNNESLFAFAIDKYMFSVMYQTLPDDIEFCVINKEGKVLFHSDKKRNLRENFIDECNHNKKIHALIANKGENLVNVKYYGKDYYCFISPVENYPFYIVSLMNKTEAQDSKFNVLLFTLICTLGILLLIFAQFFISSICSSEVSLLKENKFSLHRLGRTVKNLILLKVVIVILLVHFILFLIFTIFLNHTFLLVYSLISPVCLLVIVSFVNFVQIQSDEYSDFVKKDSYKNFIRFWIVSGGIIIFLIFSLSYLLDNYSHLKWQLPLLIVLALIIIGSKEWVKKNQDWLKEKLTDRQTVSVDKLLPIAFSIMALLYLINLCLLPMINFYRIGAEQEIILNTKERTLQQAEKYDSGHQEVAALNFQKESAVVYVNNFEDRASNSYFNEISNKPCIKGFGEGLEENLCLSKFYSKLVAGPRPDFNYNHLDYARESLIQNKSADGKWSWQLRDDGKFICLRYRLTNSDNLIYIRAPLIGYSFIEFFHLGNLFFLLLIIAILFGLVSYTYKKITLLEYYDSFELAISNSLNFIEQKRFKVHKNIIFIALPGSVLETKLITEFEKDFEEEKEESGPYISVFQRKSKSGEEPLKTIFLLKNFDLHGNNYDYEKINFCLESLHRKAEYNSSIIIVILNRDPFQSSTKIVADKELSKSCLQFIKLIEKFQIEYYPLSGEPQPKEENWNDFQKLLYSEINHGTFLQQLMETEFENDIDNQMKKEELILKIQNKAKNYYNILWMCLSNEEKFVLYDIALDGLINYKNYSVLRVLLLKGLLILNKEEHRIYIMNDSFKNFILSEVKPNEALILEQQIKIKGTWGIIRPAIILVFLIAGVILLVTQDALYVKFAGIAAALASLLPFLSNVLKITETKD